MSLIAPDVYDKLFCRCDGTGTSFVDSSTANPKSITANGNATQLSLHADFAGKRTAGFFNGTTDYVVVPDSADWDFGTGDYNVELYANFSVVQNCYLIDLNTQNFSIQYNGGTLSIYQAGSQRANGSWTPTANIWYKITAKRISGVATILVDDVQVGTSTNSDSVDGGTTGLYLGRHQNAADQYFSGWLKNLTITKAGTTVLDMKFDSPATSPLGPAIYFDGTGDSISVADHADFDMTDFTCEAFFKFDAVNKAHGLFGYDNTTDNGGINLSWNNSGTVFEANVSGTTKTDWTYAAVANKWIHVALVRSSGSVSLYVDGKPLSGTLSDSDILNPSNAFHLGVKDTQRLTGYAREWRISNTARYTSAFIPSQTGFTVDSNTKLYIKGDEDNGVTTFVDSETTPKTVTTNGDTKIKYTEDYRSCIFKDDSASAHKPYPQGSAKVDFFSAFGSGVGLFTAGTDFASVPDSDDFYFADGDFTLENYVRFNSLTSDYQVFLGQYVGDADRWFFGLGDASNNIKLYVDGTGLISKAFVPLVNTWYHIAVVRSGTTFYVFVNGISLGTNIDATAMDNIAGVLCIGTQKPSGGKALSGLLDNIRISKGIARYTATFNPPEDFETPASYNKSQFFALL